MNEGVKSAARVLDLLELLSGRQEPMRLNEIAAALDIPKSSTHGLLRTLVARGYVRKDGAERYLIAESFRSGFGWVGGFENLLRSVAQPVVEAIRNHLDETVFVSVRTDSQDARLVCKAVSRQPIRYDSPDHTPLPGYGTVMGRVLLAFQPDKVIDDYLTTTTLAPFNPRTPVAEAEIRAELARIRRDGFGEIVDQYAMGGAGVAAPIRNGEGKVVAVIDIATVTPRYEARRSEMLEAVRKGARSISDRLGYREPATGAAGKPEPEEASDGLAHRR